MIYLIPAFEKSLMLPKHLCVEVTSYRCFCFCNSYYSILFMLPTPFLLNVFCTGEPL